MKKLNCWEFKKCGREIGGCNVSSLGICPVCNEKTANGINNGKNGGRLCWIVCGSFCKGNIQGTFAEKLSTCLECDFFQTVSNEEGPEFNLGTNILSNLYSPLQIAKAYEQLCYFYNKFRDTKNQLIHSEKMATIGTLAAGVAHEINNPIAFVLSNINMLSNYMNVFQTILTKYSKLEKTLNNNNSENVNKILNNISQLKEDNQLNFIIEDINPLISQTLDGILRVKNIVQSLKNFAYKNNEIIEKINLNRIIDEALTILKKQIKDNINIIKKYTILPEISVNPTQLCQVIVNIIINANYAIKESGKILITTETTEKSIIIKIKDNGEGIPEENINKIFDPFFTTKKVGEGTGLGLYISHKIIEQHNGKIEIESETGKGTTFSIYLPISNEH